MSHFTQQFESFKLDNVDYLQLPDLPFLDELKHKYNIRDTKPADVLKTLCRSAYKKFLDNGKIPLDQRQKYIDQIKLELSTFEDLYFTDYIILIFAIIDKAREHGVFIDFGRGSCCGSLIFYLLEITGVDPLRYGLFFSRFISASRAKSIRDKDGAVWLQSDLVPDADLNLGEGRKVVLDWLNKIYPNKICKILTLNKLTGKVLIKNVAKVVAECSEPEANDLSSLVEKIFGKVDSMQETYDKSGEFKSWAANNQEAYQIALKLEGLVSHTGVHASGYLICKNDLFSTMPCQLDNEGEIISGYSMKYVPAIKVDLLGLSTNTIIRNVLDSAKIDISTLNLDSDELLYSKFQDGNLLPYGLYQLSGDCAYRVVNHVKPKNLLELSDVNAIARPAGLLYEKSYVDNSGHSPHEIFDEILKKTRYQPLYQENSIQMAVRIGLTPDEGETLRRTISKKVHSELPIWKQKIYDKCKENNIDILAADEMYKLIESSADYQFNFSHALATASTSALTTLLKYKYPLDFYLECLRNVKNTQAPHEEINLIQSELQYFNIKLLPPDLVRSQLDFSKEGENLRFGLTAIKGISDKTVEALKSFINSERTNKFEVFQAAKKSKMSVGVLSALIQAGLLQSLESNRPSLVYECNLFNKLTDREKSWVLQHGHEFEYSLFAILHKSKEILDDKGKLLFTEKRMATLQRDAEKYREIFKMNNRYPKLAAYFFEYRLLGFSYSYKIKDIFQEYSAHKLDDISICSHVLDGDSIVVAGHVASIEERTSAKKNKYIKMVIGDSTGTQEVMIFEPRLTQLKEEGLIPDEDDVVIITLKRWNETFTVQKIKLSKDKVYLKLAEMKD